MSEGKSGRVCGDVRERGRGPGAQAVCHHLLSALSPSVHVAVSCWLQMVPKSLARRSLTPFTWRKTGSQALPGVATLLFLSAGC